MAGSGHDKNFAVRTGFSCRFDSRLYADDGQMRLVLLAYLGSRSAGRRIAGNDNCLDAGFREAVYALHGQFPDFTGRLFPVWSVKGISEKEIILVRNFFHEFLQNADAAHPGVEDTDIAVISVFERIFYLL